MHVPYKRNACIHLLITHATFLDSLAFLLAVWGSVLQQQEDGVYEMVYLEHDSARRVLVLVNTHKNQQRMLGLDSTWRVEEIRCTRRRTYLVLSLISSLIYQDVYRQLVFPGLNFLKDQT